MTQVILDRPIRVIDSISKAKVDVSKVMLEF
jgi:hypothetical protein